jgi:LacI family transcriptional regulator
MIRKKQKVTSCKQIAVITSNYDNGVLKGIRKYMQEHPHWSIYLVNVSDDTDFSWLMNWKGDGMIAPIENEQIAETVLHLKLPTIDLSSMPLMPEMPFVVSKDSLTARIAADLINEKGLGRFAFFGDTKQARTDRLGHHFQTYVGNLGYPCHLLCSNTGKSKMEKKIQVARWIETLPKPIGIFTSSSGEVLLEACQLVKASVPDEVSIIHLDNDEILCELLEQQLTKVLHNPSKFGYHASLLLDEMMADHQDKIDKTEEDMPNLSSIEGLAAKDKIIYDALHFIHNNACDGITVNDVVNKVSLSRRMLEHRFRKTLGITPHEEIISARLRSVKQLLAQTELNLVSIANQTGFKHSEYLSVVFKREVGISPGQYRKLHAKGKVTVNF